MTAAMAVAAGAVAAGAAAQAVSGIGFSLVCAPVLVAVLGARDGVRTAILLSALLNLFLVVRERRGLMPGRAGSLLVPAVAATPLAAWLTRRAGERTLAVLAGVLVLATTSALARGLRVERAGGRAGAVAAGAVSATMNVVAGIGGPAAALYALNAGWPALSARSTLQAYFLVLNVVALASLGLPSLRPALVVALVAGWAGGALVAGRVCEATARRATLGLAAGGGAAAVVRAVTG